MNPTIQTASETSTDKKDRFATSFHAGALTRFHDTLKPRLIISHNAT